MSKSKNELEELKQKQNDIQSQLIRQEHRWYPILKNFWNRKKFNDAEKEKAAIKAFIFGIFLNPRNITRVIITGSIIGTVLLWSQLQIMKSDNSLLKKQLKITERKYLNDVIAESSQILITNNSIKKRVALKSYIKNQREINEEILIDVKDLDFSEIDLDDMEILTDLDLQRVKLPLKIYNTNFSGSVFSKNFDNATSVLENVLYIPGFNNFDKKSVIVFDNCNLFCTDFSNSILAPNEFIYFYKSNVEDIKLPLDEISRNKFLFIDCDNLNNDEITNKNKPFKNLAEYLQWEEIKINKLLDILLERSEFKKNEKIVREKFKDFRSFKMNRKEIFEDKQQPEGKPLKERERVYSPILEWLCVVISENGKYSINRNRKGEIPSSLVFPLGDIENIEYEVFKYHFLKKYLKETRIKL